MSIQNSFPNRHLAEKILADAEHSNPGSWGSHSRICALCAERIASKCGLDPHKAYVLGLLHDIGRKFGVRHLGHVYDGYLYMTELGFFDVARVCLTHSFCVKSANCFVGKTDISAEEAIILYKKLEETEYDEYDLLIQLCDCLAGADSILDMESRMLDVKNRYGVYPQDKWDKNMELKQHFEKLCGENIYRIVEIQLHNEGK